MSAFDHLGDRLRWVAWRNELRGPAGKPTKVPYGRGGRPAKANDPSTWVTKPEAKMLALRIINDLGGGIGYQLGDLGDDTYLGGLDLDSCVGEDGSLAPWADALLEASPSYAERSPSGLGIKIFFYLMKEHTRPFLDLIAVKNWGARRSIGANSADHGPAVEVYLRDRYFTVTDDIWDDRHERIILLDWPALERIAALIPPRADARTKPAGDNSRSAAAYRKGIALRRTGRSFDEMVEALYADPEISTWVKEKGEANDRRELFRIWDKGAPREAAGRALADVPTKWQKLIKSGDASDYGGDRSALMAAIIASLVRRGWSDDDVLPFLVDERYGSSAHCRGSGDPVGTAMAALAIVRERLEAAWDCNQFGQRKSSLRNIEKALVEMGGVAARYDAFRDRQLIAIGNEPEVYLDDQGAGSVDQD
jgi:hypothetical protein